MGKNQKKRPLNTSSSSSNSGDLSMNRSIREEEKLDGKQKSGVRENTTENEFTYSTTSLTENTVNVDDNRNTDESNVKGNDKVNSAADMRNLLCKSSENLRSENVTLEARFESYFETLAKRRSQSLENRPNQIRNHAKNSKELIHSFIHIEHLYSAPSRKTTQRRSQLQHG